MHTDKQHIVLQSPTLEKDRECGDPNKSGKDPVHPEDVHLVEIIYLLFTCMPGGVTVGDSGHCCCVPCLSNAIVSLCLEIKSKQTLAITTRSDFVCVHPFNQRRYKCLRTVSLNDRVVVELHIKKH